MTSNSKKILFLILETLIVLGGLFFLFLGQTSHANACQVTAINASLDPLGAIYMRDNPATLEWRVRTRDCNGETLTFELEEVDPTWNNIVATLDHNVQHKNSIVTARFRLGENECDTVVAANPNCKLKLVIKKSNGNKIGDSSSFLAGVVGYNCPLKAGEDDKRECFQSIMFIALGTTEIDVATSPTAFSSSDNIPPECQDEQGNLRPGCYKLLEPIGGFIDPVFDAEKQGIGGYINTIIRLALAVATLLAVLMIVVGGLQYMTTDAVGGKSDGISKMNNAVLGLLLAFGIYIILNTINPNILNLDPGIKSITLTADEQNFQETEVSKATAGTYQLKGTYENPQPSPGVSTFANHLKNDNYVLEKITINTQQKQATFHAKKGSSGKQVTIPINIGLAGVSQIGQAAFGDNKTPKGTTLTEIDRSPFLSPSTDKPIFTRDGKTNLGAAFINIGATIDNTNRGIGFHGHANNTLGVTNGCVRMYNDDLLVLGPHMGKNGIQVIIQ